MPRDTTVGIVSLVQFHLQYRISRNAYRDTTADAWSVEGAPIGTISSDGLSSVTNSGMGIIKALLGSGQATATVIATDVSSEDGDINSITIGRVYSDGRILSTHIVHKGEKCTLGGLPYPMNLLNGGQIYFSAGMPA